MIDSVESFPEIDINSYIEVWLLLLLINRSVVYLKIVCCVEWFCLNPFWNFEIKLLVSRYS